MDDAGQRSNCDQILGMELLGHADHEHELYRRLAVLDHDPFGTSSRSQDEVPYMDAPGMRKTDFTIEPELPAALHRKQLFQKGRKAVNFGSFPQELGHLADRLDPSRSAKVQGNSFGLNQFG